MSAYNDPLILTTLCLEKLYVAIPIKDDKKFLVVQLLTTSEVSHHFFAYEIMLTENYEVVELGKLALLQVLHKYCVLSNYYVVIL